MNEIWAIGGGLFKAYSDDLALIAKIARWKKVVSAAAYASQRGKVIARDIIFPSSIYNRIAKELGLLSKTKSPGRVRQGQRLSRSRSIGEVNSQKRPGKSI